MKGLKRWVSAFAAIAVGGFSLAGSSVWASQLEFTVHKLESGVPGPTLLVIGGIQGNEPGGFMSASVLVTDYEITRGRVWVVPNTNFESIIARSRGVHGDLNRKFHELDESDPEYRVIERIKALITDPKVDLVLNLHDGSGFYSPKYHDKLRNPNRWGQCIIIDEAQIGNQPWQRLYDTAHRVIGDANRYIGEPTHRYHVKNTWTRLGDKEMEKTLTYFAVREGIPAYGVEASKSFGTARRTWYHLNMLEAFMREMGIGFRRTFEFNVAGVKDLIDNNIKLDLYESRVYLDVANARKSLRFVPLKRDAPIEYRGSNPLIAIVPENEAYRVRYGNRRVTRLLPQYFDYDQSLEQVAFMVDGVKREAEIGTMIDVGSSFTVDPDLDYRVNVIGFRQSGLNSEVGVPITKKQLASRFSVDRAGSIFRVEFYRKERFSGMILVRFGSTLASTKTNTALRIPTNEKLN